jgi:hypothetical protein
MDIHYPVESFGKYAPFGGLYKGAHVTPGSILQLTLNFTCLVRVGQFNALLYTHTGASMAILQPPKTPQKFDLWPLADIKPK